MTPQESQLVDELFGRLAKLEAAPRDRDAERLIAAGLQRAPHAVYALVQTALLQDEALKRANARIEELEEQVGGADEREPEQPPSSFLDSMREAFGGRAPARGSVPSVRAGTQGYQSEGFRPQGNQSPAGYPPPPPGYPPGPTFGTGGSFLGTAASTAAGFIGGALLLDGIRSMFGHRPGETHASAFGTIADNQASPWGGHTGGSAADSRLARDAGIDHIGDHLHDAGKDQAAHTDDDPFRVADEDDDMDDDDDDDESSFDDGGFDGDDSADV